VITYYAWSANSSEYCQLGNRKKILSIGLETRSLTSVWVLLQNIIMPKVLGVEL